MNRDASVEELLPLRPVVFALLLVLRVGPLHGYGIMQRVNSHLGREALVGPGTLYRVLKELRDAGLIEHSEPPGDESDVDARRQYYRLTGHGSLVVKAEAERIAGLMRLTDLGTMLPEDSSR